MARIIFSTLGSSGDVRPLVAVARAAVDRGHDVAMATTPSYRPLLERYAVPYLEFGSDDYFESSENRSSMLERKSGFSFWMGVSNLNDLEDMYYKLHQYCRGADVIVSTPFVMVAHLVSEKLEAPLVNCCLSPASYLPDNVAGRNSDKSVFDWILRLGALRRDLNLPRMAFPQMGRFNAALTLGLYPDSLQDHEDLTLRNIVQVGYPLLRGDSLELSPDLAKWASRGPFCLFTFGSYIDHNLKFFFDAAVEACRKLNLRCLYVTPYGSNNVSRNDETVRVEKYVAHDVIMPLASAVVHHGGTGTLSEALFLKKAAVVVPFGLDQYYNAERLSKCDLSEVLPSDCVNSDSLGAAIERAMNEQERRFRGSSNQDFGIGPGIAEKAFQYISKQAEFIRPL